MEKALGHSCYYLTAVNDKGEIQAVLPLVTVKSKLFGHFLISVPFLNYGGPLGNDDGIKLLVDRASRIAEDNEVKILEIRSRAELPISLPVSHRKITVVLDVPEGGADALWKQIPAKVRSQVRRPQKEGMESRFGHDQLDGFYDVFTRNMRDLGTPTQSKKLFEEIIKEFSDDIVVGCVYYKGQVVAAGFGIMWNSEFEMTWASSLREYNKLSPNMLLYWDFMSHAIERNAKLFNFGRCTPGAGTHKFKLQWGSRDEQLWWYEQRAAGAVAPSEGDSAFQMGPKLWRKLPLPIANLLGPHIVRLIP